MKQIIQSDFPMPTLPSDAPKWAWDLMNTLGYTLRLLANREDKQVHEGTTSEIPTADGSKRFYWDADTETLYYDKGSWKKIGEHLQPVYGDKGYTTLAEAKTTIGSSLATLIIPPGTTITCSSDPAMPANIALRFLDGAKIHANTGVTVTIDGLILAEPRQIFSWSGTGTFDLMDCLTNVIYLEWWGAKAGPPYDDCSAQVTKCFNSRGDHQVITLLGVYKITSAISFGGYYRTLSIVGNSNFQCGFDLDLSGSGTGFTFGTPGTWTSQHTFLENLTFIGGAACCDYGVKFYMHSAVVRNVTFYMGAKEYALATYGMIHNTFEDIYINYCPGGSCPKGGMLMEKDPSSSWANTVWKLDLHADGNGYAGGKFVNPALKVDSFSCGEISGVIENYTKPLEFTNTNGTTGPLAIRDLYVEGGGTEATFTGVNDMCIESCLFNDASLDLIFDGCSMVKIAGCSLVNTYIEPNCRSFVLSNNGMFYSAKIYDKSGGINCLTWPVGTISGGPDRSNILYNSSLSRWNGTPAPDFFSTYGTNTKCGLGESDTTRYNSVLCEKLTTTDTYGQFAITLDAYQAQRCIGKRVTFSAWVYVPTGETLSFVEAYGGGAPSWAASTAYAVGETISDPAYGLSWVCIVAGTSGSTEPTWPAPSPGTKITDNTVTWSSQDSVAVGCRYHNYDKGSWKQIGKTTYVGTNAPSVSFGFIVYRDTTNCSAYFSNPSLVVSEVGPTGLIPGCGEAFQPFIQIGPNTISYGTAVPSSGWCQQGDIVFRTDATANQSPGWMCTTSGTGGGSAVWKAMATLAA